jgi:hypothetical protein
MADSQFFTLGQVEKEFRLSKSTLSKDRASGKLSAERRPDGSYHVALSELVRVYGDRLRRRTEETGPDNRGVERSATPSTTAEIPVLLARLEGLRAELDQVRGERDDLRRRLDEESAERRRLTLMLADHRSKPELPAVPEATTVSSGSTAGGRFRRAWVVLTRKA